jgi:hypothetical protein
MSRECSRLVSCPFFQKYKDLDENEVNRLKRLYCKGPYMDQCVRKLYKELHGVDAADHMSPEGRSLEDNSEPVNSPEKCPCLAI